MIILINYIFGQQSQTNLKNQMIWVFDNIGSVPHKRRRIFLAVLDTPLPHVGILTLIYLTSSILQHRNLRPPSALKYSDVFYGQPIFPHFSSLANGVYLIAVTK